MINIDLGTQISGKTVKALGFIRLFTSCELEKGKECAYSIVRHRNKRRKFWKVRCQVFQSGQ